jgi:ferredoxin
MVEHTVAIEIPEDADADEAGQVVELQVAETDSILAEARSRGLWLPADCQQGWCTTCAARLQAGTVDQADARRYYPVDEGAGFVLTCVAKPRSDLDLVSHQHEAMLLHRARHGLPPGSAKLDRDEGD